MSTLALDELMGFAWCDGVTSKNVSPRMRLCIEKACERVGMPESQFWQNVADLTREMKPASDSPDGGEAAATVL